MSRNKIFTTVVCAGSIVAVLGHEAHSGLALGKPMEHSHNEMTPPKDLGKFKTVITASGAAPIRINAFDDVNILSDSVSVRI